MNILVTGGWQCTREQLQSLEDLGHQVCVMPQERDALPVGYQWVEGVICNGLFLHHPIEKFTNLRYIQITSAGFDRVDMDYIRAHNIRLHNAGGVYSVPMAEYAVAGVLQLYKQSRFFAENQRQHRWQKHRGLLELQGRRVCIVGCGSVGTECAKRFAAFGCEVIGVNRSVRETVEYNRILPMEALDEVLPQADIVVLCLPLTKESRHVMDRRRIALLKEGAVLVNIARGAIVDTVALIDWLQQGQGAAVLDVFEEEPLEENSPLWDMENVILTPHNSFMGDGNGERLYKLMISNLEGMTQ